MKFTSISGLLILLVFQLPALGQSTHTRVLRSGAVFSSAQYSVPVSYVGEFQSVSGAKGGQALLRLLPSPRIPGSYDLVFSLPSAEIYAITGQRALQPRESITLGLRCKPGVRVIRFTGMDSAIFGGDCHLVTVGVKEKVVAKTCDFNGQQIADGKSVLAYSSSAVEAPKSCVSSSQVRYCRDGQLTGSFSYSSCTVSVTRPPVMPRPALCSFNGRSIPNGGAVVAYESGSATLPQRCQIQVRNCRDGQLTGSFGYGSCIQVAPTVQSSPPSPRAPANTSPPPPAETQRMRFQYLR